MSTFIFILVSIVVVVVGSFVAASILKTKRQLNKVIKNSANAAKIRKGKKENEKKILSANSVDTVPRDSMFVGRRQKGKFRE